jgi:hypothetical protein
MTYRLVDVYRRFGESNTPISRIDGYFRKALNHNDNSFDFYVTKTVFPFSYSDLNIFRKKVNLK